MRIILILVALAIVSIARPAIAAETCSATPVLAPDSSSLSILFENLAVDATTTATSCTISVPLNLPAGYSLGVYRVDYRGFAHLGDKDAATLTVGYDLGPKGNGRQFKRSVRGTDTDFTFTENIGAGQMKRVGCGVDAVLTGTFSLSLDAKGKGQLGDAMASLDSSDGTARRGIVYQFDLKRCQ